MPDSAREGYALVAGARLFYRIDGPDEAPPLLMAHSIGTDMRMWEPQVGPLAQRFRVIRYDSRGHGRSDAPPEPYTLDLLGRDALALLDALDIQRAHVCGLSLGGMVAQWLAAHHPERVSRAVLANTAMRIGSPATWDERIELVRNGGMHAIYDAALARFLSEPFRQSHEQVTRAIGELLEATPVAGYIGACHALRDSDLHDVVGRITAPTLIIAGERDVSTPPAQSHALHAAIAGSRLVILQEAAHLSNIEQPDAFTALVSGFIGGV